MKWKIVTTRRHLRIGDNRGLILPLALMAFVVLGALAAAILSIGGSEAQIASNHLRAVQAQFLAEAGLEHAFNALRTTPTLLTNINNPLIPTTQLGGAGSYTVQYQAAGLWTWRAVSTGASAIGGAQQIRRAVMSTFFQSRNAIVANDSLSITGTVGVASTNGQCGNVHSNGQLTLGGNTTINGFAAEYGDPNNPSDTVEVNGGSVTVTGGIRNHASKEPLPHIDPDGLLNGLKSNSDVRGDLNLDHLHQMKADGRVLNGNDNEIANFTNGDYCGWSYTAGPPAA
ncbi:hypothetical protein, partial [Candidatus Methylomirabilis sp.]|uniref:hypothetical protein n=1 Tax=Candidatus Methylomirabilis sp. TaxID=2032687 RepID=UPI003C7693ED